MPAGAGRLGPVRGSTSPGWPPGRRDPVGVVHDRAAGTVSATIRVNGDGQFALLDDREQDLPRRRVGWRRWPGSPVNAPTWCGSSGMTGRRRCRCRTRSASCERRWADEPATPARDSYLELMHAVAPDVVRHEVLVTVTVAVPAAPPRRRPPRRRRWRRRSPRCATSCACSGPASTAPGIQVPAVLSAADLIVATRVRSDPAAVELLAGLRQSLAAATGWAAPNFGPMTVTEELAAVRVDRAVHRTWWFARWPRREIADAGWLDGLIVGMDCTRTVSVVFEPIPPSRSDRAVDRELVQAGGEHRVAPPPRLPGHRQGPQGARRGRSPRGRAELRVRRDVLRRAGHARPPPTTTRWRRRPPSSSRSPPRSASSCSRCGASRPPAGWRRCRWAARVARRLVPA